jgi:hypothetical protein
MRLLTEEIEARLPKLYSQEQVSDPIVHCKFFMPWSNWTWFVTEGGEQDGDFLFFGLVIGHEQELGYFCLSELESIEGPCGLKLERDLLFEPGPLSEVLARFKGGPMTPLHVRSDES